MSAEATTFIVKRTNLHDGRFVTTTLDAPAGGALLKIDRFALTANNITYAAMGEAMKYWNFFPAPEAGYGVIPVWGFGTVIETQADGLSAGDRFYGYFPFGSHLAVGPVRISGQGFTDLAGHRQAMAGVYNNYTSTTADALYRSSNEAEQVLLRPLFTTSFVIDDFLADNSYFGAKAVLLTSASSKTAYGAAYFLKKREQIEVIGLTSRSNVDYVTGLGCYDRVVVYDDIGQISNDLPVTLVDMAGNATVRASIHHHFRDSLKYDCAVGATNWDADRSGAGAPLPGPKTEMFFAPTVIAKRIGLQGPKAFGEALAAAWHEFSECACNPKKPWIRVVAGKGRSDAERLYHQTLEGKTKPLDGIVLSL